LSGSGEDPEHAAAAGGRSRVLLTGASGFIGRHVAAALRAAGHEVLAVVRRPRPGAVDEIQGDFGRDLDAGLWRPRLRGVEVVINAAGILRESGRQSFSAVHIQAPRALFDACVEAGVRKVIQISALGADEAAASRFHVSKRSADRYLASLALDWAVLRPSLVFGLGGASTRLFSSLASLPLIPLVGAGEQRVQPVHVDDLAALCVRLVERTQPDGRVLDVVGPGACSMRELLAALRAMLGLGRARFVAVPRAWARAAAALAAPWPDAPFDRETLAMLERGSHADPAPFAQALGRPPRPAVPFVDLRSEPEMRAPLAAWARMGWALPLLRWSLALVWLVTGLLSLGIFPVEESRALLARTGLSGAPADVALYGAAVLDLAMGLGILLLRRRTWLWRLQLLLVVVYSAVIAVALPEFWLHPFGPVLKNVALLALIVVLHEADRAR
jgi:uncharacterized protein YbjT (DUF2867 family)